MPRKKKQAKSKAGDNGEHRPVMGRPRKKLDLNQVYLLGYWSMPKCDASHFLGIDRTTFDRRLREDESFREAWERGCGDFRRMVRRGIVEKVKAGDWAALQHEDKKITPERLDVRLDEHVTVEHRIDDPDKLGEILDILADVGALPAEGEISGPH
jgi:hypothetical protein